MAAITLPVALLASAALAAGATTAVALTSKSAAAPKSLPTADRQAQATAIANSQADDLRRRRGAGANALTGPSGAEASTPGAKVLLGQ